MLKDEELFKTPSTKRKRVKKSLKNKSTGQVTVDSANRNDDTECSSVESDVEATASRNDRSSRCVHIWKNKIIPSENKEY